MAETPPQACWDITMIQASQTHARRQWATLGMLLRQARGAPDAPPWDDEREDVRTWQDLHGALALHQGEAHAHIRAAVHLLTQRLQDRCGAAGSPDPTPDDMWAWLRWHVETLDMEEVDAAVEERRQGHTHLERFCRTNASRGRWEELTRKAGSGAVPPETR